MKDLNSYELYLNEIKNTVYLTEAEETNLFNLAKNGDMAARKRIIESALHFVISLAKKFKIPKAFSFNDLVGYGNEGLMEAYNHFKPGKNARFLTYSYFWIYKYMNDAVHNYSRMIRLPQTWEDKLSKIFKSLENPDDCMSGPNSLCGWTESEKIRYVAEKLNMKESEVQKLINAAGTEVSLDAPLGMENENETLGSKVSGDELSPEENCQNTMLSEYIWNILDALPELYGRILIERNGLDNKGIRSLQKIADELGICKEQVRTYERRALSMAKKMAEEMELDYYLAA